MNTLNEAVLTGTHILCFEYKIMCLFGLRLYIPVNNFSVKAGHFPELNQYSAMKIKCLAQGHDTTPLVRFEPPTCNQETCTLRTELSVLP